MNEDELIELIQSRLPQDLTARQIRELRKMMRTSPRLRDALLEELSIEQGLATRFAPAVESAEQVVEQLIHQAGKRRRARRLGFYLGTLLALLAAVGGVLLTAYCLIPSPSGPSTDTAVAHPAAQATRPASRPAGGSAIAAAGTGRASAGPAKAASGTAAPTSQPAPAPPTPPAPAGAPVAAPQSPPPAEPVAPLPDWKLYEPLPQYGGTALREQLRGLFKEAGGTSIRTERNCVRVQGRLTLRTKLTTGRLLRLSLQDARKLSILASRGTRAVQFVRQGDESFVGYIQARKFRDAPGVRAVSDPRWRYFARGELDLRYQDGNMVLARAHVPLLALPLGGPPGAVEVRLEGRLLGAAVLPCPPLPLAAPRRARPIVESTHVAALGWRAEPPAGGVDLRRHADGTLEIAAKGLREDVYVWADFTAAPGRFAAVRIADFGESVGFLARCQAARRGTRVFAVQHRDGYVLTTNPSSSSAREEAYGRGLLVRGPFWVRMRMGLDFFAVDFSADGRHWGELLDVTLESHYPADGPMQLGIYLPGRRDSRIRLTGVRIDQREGFAGLADPALVAKVALSDAVRREGDMEKAISALAAGRPADATELDWRLACDAALARGSAIPAVRTACAADLVQRAPGSDANTSAVLSAVEDLAELTHTRRKDSTAWRVMSAACEELARRCFSAGRRAEMPQIVDFWLGRGLRHFPDQWDLKTPLPEPLARLLVYHLLAEGDRDRLAEKSSRLLALYRPPWRDRFRQRDDLPVGARLLLWALAEGRSAHAGQPGGPGGDWSGAWSHPLSLQFDRETLNVIAEFIASVNAGAYEHAAKVLAGQVLPDGIVPTGGDENLYQAIHFRIRRLLQTHEDLARTLRERFEAIGTVRLRRALRDGDIATLEALAVQFHGTAPARQALYHLADRDLSMGNVVGAAAKYDELLRTAGGAERQMLEAKFRLASTLAGQPAGKPVTGPVDLGGERMSAAEFEAMIASLAPGRSTAGPRRFATVSRPVAPPAGRCEVTEVVGLSAHGQDRTRPFARLAGWSGDARGLLVHLRGRLVAVDPQKRKILWTAEQSLQSAPEAVDRARPLRVGARVYVRMQARREHVLACFDAATGRQLWVQRLDDGVLSDPILINSRLFVLTARRGLGDLVDIYLRRVSPESGRSTLAAKVVSLRAGSPRLLAPGRLCLVSEALVFRCAATLVCCDLLGQVRWLRRLTFVPPEIDRALTYDLEPGDIAVRGGRVIFAARACPGIQCVEAGTGRQLWSYLQPDLRSFVGLVGDRVVLTTPTHIEALDAETGRPVWRAARTAGTDAILPAADGTLCCVTLDRVDPANRRRYGRGIRRVRWLAAADGRTVRSEPIEDAALHGVLYDITALYAAGADLFCLAPADPKSATARLFRIRVR